MPRTVLRILANVFIVAFAILCLDGCVIAHRGCLRTGTIIPPSDRILIDLAELTSPGPGRNITATTHEDRITATITPLRPGSAQFEIQLVADGQVTWWKGAEVVQGSFVPSLSCFFDQAGQRVTIAETENQRTTSSVLVLNTLAEQTTLVLWKAKAAGFKTPMYLVRGNLSALQGQRLTIRWEID